MRLTAISQIYGNVVEGTSKGVVSVIILFLLFRLYDCLKLPRIFLMLAFNMKALFLELQRLGLLSSSFLD